MIGKVLIMFWSIQVYFLVLFYFLRLKFGLKWRSVKNFSVLFSVDVQVVSVYVETNGWKTLKVESEADSS